MKVQRGDVILTRVPHAAGGRRKKRRKIVTLCLHYCYAISGENLDPVLSECRPFLSECQSLAVNNEALLSDCHSLAHQYQRLALAQN